MFSAKAESFAARDLRLKLERTKVLLGVSGPARTILAVAEEEGADLIVMATHGRDGSGRIENLPLGSVAMLVVEKQSVRILLIPVRHSIEDK